jgi:ferredoxin
LTDIGSDFLIEAVTEAGSVLLEKSNCLQEATVENEAAARKTKENARKKITRKLDVKAIRDRLSTVFEDQGYWEKAAVSCISCGVCTLLCPTCHCFDISDETSNGRGHRLRSPDSCSFAEYSKMPSENPREEKWRRLRNRICHKYLFFPMNFGVTACTGCGRCIRMCPVKWDIVKVLGDLTTNTSEVH